jgi:F0F1-type ATP synthase alpha subunit
MTMEEQVCVIYAGVNGYLDGVPVAKVGRYEEELKHELRTRARTILAAVRDTGDLKEDTEKQLRELIGLHQRFRLRPAERSRWPISRNSRAGSPASSRRRRSRAP